MHIILVYDICLDDKGAKILRNTFKICNKYLTHIQNSVFEGNLKESQFIALKYELKKHIRKDTDSVIIFTMQSENWLTKEFIGKTENKLSPFF
jgi:CRISPR-associated protein Cas2